MKYYALKLFGRAILTEAKKFADLCLSGNRWNGNPVLIILDACLDSSGLNYFTVVVPKVREFREKYIKNGRIKVCKDLQKIPRKELLKVFGNNRVWDAMIKICMFVSEDKKKSDMQKLKNWSKNADYCNIENDPIGRIRGVGINTFQYLRMQSGVNTIMPDKIIARWISKNFSEVNNPQECIEKGLEIARDMSISGIELCWAIWIKESHELSRIEIE